MTTPFSPRPPLLRPAPPGGELVERIRRLDPEMGDRRAIEEWIRSYGTRSPHTARSVRKEVERFLMFLDVVKGPSDRHLPAVSTTDALNYQAFLTHPEDYPELIEAFQDGELLARYGRTAAPFNFERGALKESSRKIAITYLARMYRKLSHIRNADGSPYVMINPWEIVTEGQAFRPLRIEQALTQDEWSAVKKAIDALPRDTEERLATYHRTRWTMQLLYRLWLRREEAAKLRMSNFVQTPDGWEVRFVGKGRKEAAISASDTLMAELKIYRESLGLPPYPTYGENRPAIGALRTAREPAGAALRTSVRPLGAAGRATRGVDPVQDGVQPMTIYRICRGLFDAAANLIEPTDPFAAARLRKASPHWMRHSGVTHALEGGVPDRYVQAHARHANRSMLDRYDHKDRRAGRNHINSLKDPESS